MDYIKSHKTLFIVLAVIVILAGGFLYYESILTPQLETLQMLEHDNYEMESELMMLESELPRLADREEDVMNLGYEINGLEDRIPSYELSVLLAAEIYEYVHMYDFKDPEVQVDQEVVMEEEQEYKTIPVNINFESTYEDATRFVEKLNRSKQIVTLDYLSINSDIQEEADEFGQYTADLVTAELVLLIHYRDKEGEKIYSNFTDYTNKQENIFEKIGLDEQGNLQAQQDKANQGNLENQGNQANQGNQEENEDTQQTEVKEKTTFNLHVADIYRSGDNYSFSAYSPDEDSTYVGLTSAKDTKMIVTIRENGYQCVIQDSGGNISEKQIDTKVINPNINITSQIQKVMEDMPDVSIYIKNYTPNVININMRGTSLDHINIYNENNKLVKMGEQSGRISLK